MDLSEDQMMAMYTLNPQSISAEMGTKAFMRGWTRFMDLLAPKEAMFLKGTFNRTSCRFADDLPPLKSYQWMVGKYGDFLNPPGRWCVTWVERRPDALLMHLSHCSGPMLDSWILGVMIQGFPVEFLCHIKRFAPARFILDEMHAKNLCCDVVNANEWHKAFPHNTI